MTLQIAVRRRPWRFSTRVVLPVSLAAVAIIASTALGLFWATHQSDRASVERQIRTAEVAITSVIDAMAHDQEVVAVWDDAVVKTHGEPDLKWIDVNLGVWMHTLFGHERVFVLDDRDEPIYAMVGGAQAPVSLFEADRSALRMLVEEARGRATPVHHRHDRLANTMKNQLPADLRTTEKAVHASHFLQVEGRPAVASVMRIVPHSDELTLEPGTETLIASVRFLDGRFLSELATRNLIDGARYSASGDRRPGEEALALLTEFGELIGYILWHPELPGTQIMTIVAPVTAASAGGIVIIMIVLVRSLSRALGDLRIALKEAQQGSDAKSEFLASMSHEIRTPLNSIMGFTDLILDRRDLPAEVRRSLALVKASGTALLTVIDDVLDFSKIEAGAVELHPAPFSPTALVNNCVSIVRDLAIKKGLRMDVRLEGAVPCGLIGDEPRLRQVLLNLLNNAVKFTPAGAIVLTVRHEAGTIEGERLRFTVADTGIGIPLDKQRELFQRFRQVDGSATRRFGGTGLGLAISKSLVVQMGGEIGVESLPGAGAAFWFTVTLPRASQSALAPSGSDAGPVRLRRAARILLVEDVEVNQEIAKAVLEGGGYTVDVVGDGAQAVQAVQHGTYDMVLMDVQMPVMDGVTATRQIRSLPGPVSRIPIVAMTANVYADQVACFRQSGMQDHVGKPFQRAELFETIERWLLDAPVREEALNAS